MYIRRLCYVKINFRKVIRQSIQKFKISNLDDSFTLQKLINRSMDLYVHDESFRKTITEHTNLKPSGSAL